MEIHEDSTFCVIDAFSFGSVTSTSGYASNLTFFGSGVKTVTATLTNICTNESKSISQQVIVN